MEGSDNLIVGVLVEITSKSVDRVFDYYVPKDLESFIEVGKRVKVPFGNRTLVGFILEKDKTSDASNLKEIIEVYDNIILNNYLDLDKVIKNSTIPLSKLEFNYSNNCSNTKLIIKYKDFKEEISVTFNCKDYPKSKSVRGKTKSLKREIVAIMFKTLFLRNL